MSVHGFQREGPSLEAVNELVRAYVERHGSSAKPAGILLACWDLYQSRERPASVPTDEVIRVVWRRELASLGESKRATRVAQLRNSYSVNKRVLNRRLLELVADGQNPLLIGLTERNVFGALGDRIEDLARRERSPWVTDWIRFELEILDVDGHRARMVKRERLVPLVKGLTQFIHEIGSDGDVQDLAVQPGRIYRQERKAGKIEIVQVFDQPFPPEGAEVELAYSDVDAYRNVNEYWMFFCAIPTRGDVSFSALFPSDRFPREASTYLIAPAWNLVLLPPESQPQLSVQDDGRHRLLWRIIRPGFRERYELRWRW